MNSGPASRGPTTGAGTAPGLAATRDRGGASELGGGGPAAPAHRRRARWGKGGPNTSEGKRTPFEGRGGTTLTGYLLSTSVRPKWRGSTARGRTSGRRRRRRGRRGAGRLGGACGGGVVAIRRPDAAVDGEVLAAGTAVVVDAGGSTSGRWLRRFCSTAEERGSGAWHRAQHGDGHRRGTVSAGC
jgi:hypothetical protein